MTKNPENQDVTLAAQGAATTPEPQVEVKESVAVEQDAAQTAPTESEPTLDAVTVEVEAAAEQTATEEVAAEAATEEVATEEVATQEAAAETAVEEAAIEEVATEAAEAEVATETAEAEAATEEAATEEAATKEAATEEAATEEAEEEAKEDLMAMTTEELCAQLASDIENLAIAVLKERVETLKVVFYKKIKAADEALRAEFVAGGGVAEEFKAEITAEEERFKALLTLYRDNRNKFNAQTEEQKEANYKAKLALVEELKALVNSTETMGATFAQFKDIQSKWREIGSVPLSLTKDLWETYHHHTENFYNFVKINRELRDLDLKRNLEAKTAICESAEALLEISSPITAFNELQKLHDEYREAGPVDAEFKESLWERFKVASSKINKRHQEHYDKIREEQEKNLAKKAVLCESCETLLEAMPTTVAEWNEKQVAVTELQKEWKTIGFAPKKDNNAIYERFCNACDKFFTQKREFFAGLKGEMNVNLEAKRALCVAAEELSESSEWKEATDKLIELQKEWKSVGAVSRKHSDALWKRFRGACDKFFERKSAHFKQSDAKYNDNLEAKRAIIEELKALEGSEELTFEALKEIMHRYGAVGFVPIRKKEALGKEFKAACDTLFDMLRAREGSERIERYRKRASEARVGGGGGSMGGEREKLTNRLRTLQNELKVLENNIGFFAASKGNSTNPFVVEVERKIEKTKNDIAEVIEKINILSEEV